MAIKGQHTEKLQGPAKDKNKQPLSKVVVRRLPPDMTAETFQQQVAPLPEHDYMAFVPADRGLGPHAFARAYINFLSQNDIVLFRDRFDGYVFVDQQGFEYPAVVEYAPCQRIPRRRARKPDAKAGTIADDADYKAFLEAAEAAEEAPTTWETTLEEIEKRRAEAKENVPLTPLVSFVCKRRAEKKEERRRRELERRKEEARVVKTKTAKEKARDKDRHDSKEMPKGLWGDEKEGRYETVFTSKKYEEQLKERHGKDGLLRKDSRGDKDDKYGKRKERAEKWKEADQSKHEDKVRKEKEPRKKDSDWEEKKKKPDKKARPSEPSSDSGPRGRGSSERTERPERAGGERGGSGRSDPEPEKASDRPRSPPTQAEELTKPRRDSKGGDRKIRNKDRPDLAIYRPGMGKYSSRRLQERDGRSSSPPPAGAGGGDADGDGGARRTLVFRRSRAANASE